MTRTLAGLTLGLPLGVGLGLAMQFPHDRALREAHAESDAAQRAACEVATVDGVLRLAEGWGLLMPTGLGE